MKSYLIVLLLFLFIYSCSDGPSKSGYENLKSELEECKKENEKNQKIIEDLKVTPEQKLAEAKIYLDEKNYSVAKEKYESIITHYPNSDISRKAIGYLNQVEASIQKQKEEQERLKTLGFRALKETNKVEVGAVVINFNKISFSKNFVFDRYDDRYHYREAERGNKYVTSSVSISSEIKDPKLPPVYVYKILNGELKYVTSLDYEFARWDDYGSYLGNYADFRNDFSHTKTIRFELGSQISEDVIKSNPVFIIVGNENTYQRNYDRFSNPPVSYTKSTYNYKDNLKVEDFTQDFILVKIFNKNLL